MLYAQRNSLLDILPDAALCLAWPAIDEIDVDGGEAHVQRHRHSAHSLLPVMAALEQAQSVRVKSLHAEGKPVHPPVLKKPELFPRAGVGVDFTAVFACAFRKKG